MFIAVGAVVEDEDDNLPDLSFEGANLSYEETCEYAYMIADVLNSVPKRDLSLRRLKSAVAAKAKAKAKAKASGHGL